MGNEILRDVFFACAGVLMVIALIGLPRQGQAGRPDWQMQFQGTQSTTHLLPCYNCTPNQPRVVNPGSGEPPSLTP